MNVLIYVGIGLGALMVILIGIFIFFKLKGSKKFLFKLYSNDARTVKTITAKVRVSLENKNEKKFYFDGSDSELEVRQPTLWDNGIAFREVTFDTHGNYCYLKGAKLDDDNYRKLALTPEEKQLALFRFRENQKRFENPMTKMAAYMLLGSLVLCMVVVIGSSYTIYVMVSGLITVEKIATQNQETILGIQRTTDAMLEINNVMTDILTILVSDANITRRLE